MRLIGKIIALPFVIVFSLMGAVMNFLFGVASGLLTVASAILALLAIFAFFTIGIGDGFFFLVSAFLSSPFGLPAIAEGLIGLVVGINDRLKFFLMT